MSNIVSPRPLRPGVSISGNTVSVTSRDRIAETIARLDAVGEGWRKPLFRAARDGAIALMMSSHGQRLDKRMLADRRRPQLLVLADDHPAATGPDGWSQARKLMAWCRGVIIHAAAGEERWSALAVDATLNVGRVVMVECELRHHAAWLKLAVAHRRRHVSILPTGGMHPLNGPPAGTVMQ